MFNINSQVLVSGKYCGYLEIRGRQERFRDFICCSVFTTVGIRLVLLLVILARAMVNNMDAPGQITV